MNENERMKSVNIVYCAKSVMLSYEYLHKLSMVCLARNHWTGLWAIAMQRCCNIGLSRELWMALAAENALSFPQRRWDCMRESSNIRGVNCEFCWTQVIHIQIYIYILYWLSNPILSGIKHGEGKLSRICNIWYANMYIYDFLSTPDIVCHVYNLMSIGKNMRFQYPY